MLRLSQASKELGVSPNTLRAWTNQGRITCSRTITGQRIFSSEDLQSTTGGPSRKLQHTRETIICYSRVSSSKQRDDLVTQRAYLQSRIPNEYSKSKCIQINDVASGLNFKRPGLLHLLGLVTQGIVSAVIVASKDRLCRFGYELIEWMCLQHNTKIVVLNNKDSTPEAELGEDLMSIVQVYCCRWNGKRRYAAKQNSESIQVEIKTDIGAKDIVKTVGGLC